MWRMFITKHGHISCYHSYNTRAPFNSSLNMTNKINKLLIPSGCIHNLRFQTPSTFFEFSSMCINNMTKLDNVTNVWLLKWFLFFQMQIHVMLSCLLIWTKDNQALDTCIKPNTSNKLQKHFHISTKVLCTLYQQYNLGCWLFLSKKTKLFSLVECIHDIHKILLLLKKISQ